jgi:hypothetical protein
MANGLVRMAIRWRHKGGGMIVFGGRAIAEAPIILIRGKVEGLKFLTSCLECCSRSAHQCTGKSDQTGPEKQQRSWFRNGSD